jgi:hypothetical protein
MKPYTCCTAACCTCSTCHHLPITGLRRTTCTQTFGVAKPVKGSGTTSAGGPHSGCSDIAATATGH